MVLALQTELVEANMKCANGQKPYNSIKERVQTLFVNITALLCKTVAHHRLGGKMNGLFNRFCGQQGFQIQTALKRHEIVA